jgi:tetratricopeptide (TPR) repeat protein/predicted Ser/Thr protein kinase
MILTRPYTDLTERCLDRASLKRWLHEDRRDNDLDSTAIHLQSCHRCQELVEELTSASELRAVFLSNSTTATLHSEVVETLKQRIESALPNAHVMSQSFRDSCQTESTTSRGPLPERIGRYSVIRLLGRGGMGAVYMAEDPELKRHVAVKILDAPHQELRARLEREAQAIARLNSEYVVGLHSMEYDDAKHPFLVMEFVDGLSLSQTLQREARLTEAKAVQICLSIARGVQAAHAAGVLHRDIKPSNILLTSMGHVKVSDFGLASLQDHDVGLTRTGSAAGTPAYISPEVAAGSKATVASDVYGLGCVLYEMLTGVAPYQGTAFQILRRLQTDQPLRVRTLNEQVSPDVQTICEKAMSREPGHRYVSAGDMAEDLSLWLEGKTIHARPVSSAESCIRWCKRNPRVSLLAGVVGVLLIAITVGSQVAMLKIAESARQTQTAKDASETRAAEANRLRAIALDQLNDLVHRFQLELKDRPGLLPVRKSILESALRGLQQIAEVQDPDLMDRSTALAHLRISEVQNSLGHPELTDVHLNKSSLLAMQLYEKTPEDPVACRDLATVLLAQFESARGRLDLDSAERSIAQARKLLEKALELDSTVPQAYVEMAMVLIRIGESGLSRGQSPQQAKEYFELAHSMSTKAMELNPDDRLTRRAHAIALNRMTWIALDFGSVDEAEPLALAWQSISAKLLLEDPENTTYRRDAALALAQLAKIASRRNQIAKAIDYSAESTKRYQDIADADPENIVAQSHLAVAHYAEGTILFSANDLMRAKQSWLANVEIHERLFESNPATTNYAILAADASFSIVTLEAHRGAIDSAIAFAERAIGMLDRINTTDAQSTLLKTSRKGYEDRLQLLVETKRLCDNASFEEIIESDPKTALCCAFTKASSEHIGEALEIIEALLARVDESERDALFYYWLAGVQGRILSLTPDEAKREVLASQTIESLKRSLALSSDYLSSARIDPAFLPLRQRDDFQKLFQK